MVSTIDYSESSTVRLPIEIRTRVHAPVAIEIIGEMGEAQKARL